MDAHTVNATLEGKFNVLGIKLPQGMYHRNFCNWKFKSRECGFMWQGGGAGYPNVTGTLDSENFPFADATKCDHTLKGSNGCLAHNNVKRFGGFPAIPSVR
jgi:phage-related protein